MTFQAPHVIVGSTSAEMDRKVDLVRRLKGGGIPESELLDNLGLFLTRQALARINLAGSKIKCNTLIRCCDEETI
jgi:hypothetical protein